MNRTRQSFPDGLSHTVTSCLAFLLLSPILVPLVATVLIVLFAYKIGLSVTVWAVWCRQGRDCLLVYSNSPLWQTYVEQHILPPLSARAVILNWSERKKWKQSLATKIFKHFGGPNNFNPIVVVFRPFRTTKVFRFRQPFRDHKHGDSNSLEEITRDLFDLLSIPTVPTLPR